MAAKYSLDDVRDKDAVWLLVTKPIPLDIVNRNAILNALAYSKGRQDKAARHLAISDHRMRVAMRRYGVPSATQDKPRPRQKNRWAYGKKPAK